MSKNQSTPFGVTVHRHGQTSVATDRLGQYVRSGNRLLCSDGKIRATSQMAQVAGTYFSVPCGVKVNGVYVHGYMTTETHYTEATGAQPVYVFRHHNGQDQHLPPWPVPSDNGEAALLALLQKGL